jgi:hypothetical protein
LLSIGSGRQLTKIKGSIKINGLKGTNAENIASFLLLIAAAVKADTKKKKPLKTNRRAFCLEGQLR